MNFLFKFLKRKKKMPTLEEYVEARLAKGDTNEEIRKDLLNDLNNGGSIFGDFKKSLQPTFEGSVRRFKDTGQLAKTGISATHKLCLTNSKKYPACPDCLALEGQIKTTEEWEKLGFKVFGKRKNSCKNNCMYLFISAECEPI